VKSRLWQVVSVFALAPAIAAPNSGIIRVTSVRSWSHPGSTRVILQTTGPFEYHSNRAYGPDRLFFDILRARPLIDNKRYATRVVNDGLVKRIRVAETLPGTTRIVFDLAGPADYSVRRLAGPDRMLIEVRASRPVHPNVAVMHTVASEYSAPASPYVAPRPYHEMVPNAPSFVIGEAYPVIGKASHSFGKAFVYPAPPVPRSLVLLPAPPLDQFAFLYSPAISAAALPGPATPKKHVRGMSTKVMAGMPAATRDFAARPPANATRSLTRALGLKINRVVIDAGHGGHDDGTIGRHGVLEKDVVLDVALRLASLVQSRMGAEVILTRSDDTFIPLHERTAIANEHKADLFLSIHANSSPSPVVGGIETFYLNFTNSSSALEVAARENSGSDKSVGELKDLIQSITLNDKITESQTFARDIQAPLYAQAASANVAAHDRGIKRAPFVVLIGASMPSVLAEIGFLSNSRDERNLNRPEYRQKIAEALYRGISSYSNSLSHFEVASTAKARPVTGGN
jgi:N-acetylmuramoyl-L-alanine amidase